VGAVLANPGAWRWCGSPLCKALVRLRALDALAQAGDVRSTFLSDILAQDSKLDLADRIRLERLLFSLPAFASRAQANLHTITDRIYETGATASINVAEPYPWLGLRWSGETTVAQAQALRLVIGRMSPDEVDNLTTSLLALRRDGSWGCAGENAEALDALTDLLAPPQDNHFSRRAPQPSNFVATVRVGAKGIGTAKFAGARIPQHTFTIPIAALPRGTNSITLARKGRGTLHYAVTYTYRLSGAAPGRLHGLRVTREIHPANGTSILATMGLTMPSAPATLPAGAVYDIGVQIIADHPVDHVAIEDPIPAGMEIVDTSFQTSTTAFVAQSDSWAIDYQKIYRDRVEAYADRLGPGLYVLHYLVRTVTPGTYAWPGAQAHLVEQPQEFGRTAATTLVVR
jgi:uncharacterized protein YfaS (alpha-2-macroglobulin family)